MLHSGLYEQVINEKLNTELSDIPEVCQAEKEIDPAEASQILADYVAEIVKKGLDQVADEGDSLHRQILLTNKIVCTIKEVTNDSGFQSLTVAERAEQLLAILSEADPLFVLGKKAKDLDRPETSIAKSSLFTGAVHEPQMFSELKKEILSADQIDMLVSFIKWSGLRLLMDELRFFTEKGGKLRIITTSYMGATDIKAVEELNKLPNTEIKVSYDTKRTRLHAKTYVFYRETGFTTAYVGSSNLSNAAISSGLEWNVKVTQKDLPDTIRKITATFDSYWNCDEFEIYENNAKDRLIKALKAERFYEDGKGRAFFFDIHPYPYQQEILDRLTADREIRQQFRNLIVAATGTGKTVIAAFDYKRFFHKQQDPKTRTGKGTARLLFVAHREEILKQSLETFQGVLKDANFGELFVGNYRPDSLEHLFVSIQTVNSQQLYERLSEDYYDYIIIDEFHHAAAPTYQKLLSHFHPQILLGLTATPERMDGKSILDYFDGRTAAEIRLPEAIDRKLLCPFQYFGVSEDTDLSELRWVRGGYEKKELSNLFTINQAVAEKRAKYIASTMERYVTDLDDVKGLGFCVSVEHADFMAERFNRYGIPSISLTRTSSDEERSNAKKRLVSGEIRFIFVVDIYNEGVDIPEVNTVLFLRPTESLTIFLQQLGRGLRLAEGKECLTVLDYIGQANKKYNFEEKFAALLDNTRHSVQQEIRNGFTAVPKGCYIQLEKKAQRVILENIRSSFNGKAGLISRISTFTEDTGQELTFENFIRYYRLDPRTIYKGNVSFSRLCALAKVIPDFSQEPEEVAVSKALVRVTAIDSRRWISSLKKLLIDINNADFWNLSGEERIMLQMLYVTVWQKAVFNLEDEEFLDHIYGLADSPHILQEILDLLDYQYKNIDFVDEPVDLGFDCPLDLHCTYTRDQLLVGLHFDKQPNTVREGVKYLPGQKVDILMVTLNKADKDYSPTTMYNDYSINENLFHWQSQSTTSEDSPTGQRYIHHESMGSSVLLFVREFKNDGFGAAPYTYLGRVRHLQHNGSRPMNIIWKLEKSIPAKYIRKTNKLVG